MKIEKLDIMICNELSRGSAALFEKINELIDAVDTLERLREFQTASFLEAMTNHRKRLEKLESLTDKSSDSDIQPLKCPWCNTAPYWEFDSEGHAQLLCSNNQCDVQPCTKSLSKTLNEEIEIWNKRHDH